MPNYLDLPLDKLNSATKYPSIPTHHTLAPNGTLLESGNPFAEHPGPVYVTEKIDGVNARLICYEDDWFIGSREDLLAAQGDRIHRLDHRIVEALLPYTGTWIDTEYKLCVYYVEVYGDRKMPGHKIYGNGQDIGLRLFDYAEIPVNVMDWDIERIASWRDNGGQHFESWPLGHTLWQPVRPVPLLHTFTTGAEVPTTITEMHKFMETVADTTQVSINGTGLGRRPEGIVLRTDDRSIITKARYQNYERTFQLNGAPA